MDAIMATSLMLRAWEKRTVLKKNKATQSVFEALQDISHP
jgi:hypothetical protein